MPMHASTHASALAAGVRAAMTARLRAFSARSGVAFSDWDITRPWQPALLHHLLQARANC
jgi:hypothetical protein